MKLKDVDNQLAVKLGDPVSNNGDGTIFRSEHRKSYLNNAYKRLSRVLRVTMRKYQPSWNEPRKVYSILHKNIPSNPQPPQGGNLPTPDIGDTA
jgi:hypothetical protein